MSRIRYGGNTYEVNGDGSFGSDRVRLTPERLTEIVMEGTILGRDDEPLTGAVLERVRARMLGRYADLPRPTRLSAYRRPTEAQRWLIPGLWPWGTIPMLGGNPKAGKTTLVVDLVASLAVSGRRFLGSFEPAQVTDEERERCIWLINAETPVPALEEALWPELDVEVVHESLTIRANQLVNIDHLEQLGGAQMFDLTDPEIYKLWAHRLIECEFCDGSDDWPPAFVVIVDGLTAILQAAGKGVEAYGEWYAAFRRLMREVDVPNALAVAHNTMSGSHLMGGVEAQAGADGLWTYSSDNPDNPRSKRRFGVVPRMGGKAILPTEVRRVEDRLVLVSNEAGETAPVAATREADEVLAVAHRHAAYVREHPGVDGQALTDNVDAGGWKERSLAGRAKAIELGLIREQRCGPGCTVCERPHNRRRHYWPPEAVDAVVVEAG